MDMFQMVKRFFWLTIIPRIVGRASIAVLLITFSRDLGNKVNRDVALYLGLFMIVWVVFSVYRAITTYKKIENSLEIN